MENLKKRLSKQRKYHQSLPTVLIARVNSAILYTGADGARILKKNLDAKIALRKS